MVIQRPGGGTGGTSDDDDTGGGYAGPGSVGADDPGSIDPAPDPDPDPSDDDGYAPAPEPEDESTGTGGMADPGAVGADDPGSIPGDQSGGNDTDDGSDVGDGGMASPEDVGATDPPSIGDNGDIGAGDPGRTDTTKPSAGDTDTSDPVLTREQLADAASAATTGAGELARRTRDVATGVAPDRQDLRAAAAAAASGAGELARGTDATDFSPYAGQAEDIAGNVEQRYPTLDRGEDYTVSIDETGEWGIQLSESGEREVRRTRQQLQAGAAAATSGPGELARGTPDVEAPDDLVWGLAETETGFRPRGGGTVAREEARTGVDVDNDGHVTTPEEYIRGAAERSFESQTGAELDEDDVAVTRDRGGNVSAYLTPSGEAAVEDALARTSLTLTGQAETAAPPGPRTYGRTGDEPAPSITVAGPSAGVDVESGAYGTDVGTSERAVFGEFRGPLWSGYEETVEGATGAVEEFTDDAASLGAPLVGFSVGLATSGDGSTATKLTRGGISGLGDLVVGGGEVVTEGPELAYALSTSGEARAAAPAAAGGMLAATGQAAVENPYFFAGQLAGSAALSGGAVSALQGTRFGGAARFAASPVGTTLRSGTPNVRGATRGGAERAAGTARDMVDRVPEFRRDTSTRGGMDAQNLYGQPPRAVETRSDAFDTGEAEGGSGTITSEDIDPDVDTSPGTLPGNEGAGVDTGEAWSPGGAWPDHMLPEGHPMRTDTEGPSGQRALELAEERRAAAANERLAMAQERRVDAGVRRRFEAAGGFTGVGDVGYRSRQRLESAQALEVQQRTRELEAAELSVGFDSGIGIVSEYETESAVEPGAETETGVESELASETAVATEAELSVGFESEGATESETEARARRRRRREDDRDSMGFSFGRADSERDEDAGLGYIGETFAGIAGVDYEAAAGRTSVEQARETGLPDFSRGQQEAFSETLDVFGLGGR